MEYLADTPSGDPMHYMYAYIGAVWNAQTGFWEINGLVDVTREEMQDVYFESVSHKMYTEKQYGNLRSRTITVCVNMMNEGNTIFNLQHYFARSYALETIRLCRYNGKELEDVANLYANDLSYCFERCERLKIVKGRVVCRDVASCEGAFHNCIELQTVFLLHLGTNVSFGHSSKLTLESILFMIDNAQNNQFTITLHPTAYARAIVDAGVQAALATHPNLSLASA